MVEAELCPPTARLASISADLRRLVVLGDSLSFHGPEGPVPLDDERLYPNRLARLLDTRTRQTWSVEVWARAGWGLRELWLGLQKDVHLQQQVLVHADAVVLGMANADQLSVGVPRWVVMALPYLRPKGLRRELRRRLDHAHPHLVRLTRGRLAYTPPAVIEHCFVKSVDAIRLFCGEDVPLATIVGPDHRSTYYGGVRRYHDRTTALVTRLAEERGVRYLDAEPLIQPRLDQLNVDGIHWSWEIHRLVAEGLADALLGPPAQ